MFEFKIKQLRNFLTPFLYLSIILNLLSYGFFIYIFFSHQFEFDVVYRNSNLLMPKILLLSATWAGQAGSLLLWSIFGCLVLFLANRNKKWRESVLPILLIQQTVLMFLIWNAKPFAKTLIIFRDGLGMNPVLSHIYMIIHPPFAFLGYSFLSLIFAYGIASLLINNFSEWVTIIRKYIPLALFGLTTAILLGSLWAYQTSGWGGYWAFDPIESGSLVTCLLLFAILHLVNLYKSKGIGLKLLYLLVILCFSSQIHLVLLIRSGLLQNLTQHSYTGEGLLIGLLMADMIYFAFPIILLLCKLKKIPLSKNPVKLISRSGRIRLLVWIFLCMAIILFIDINLPFFFSIFNQSVFSLDFQTLLVKIFSQNLKIIFGGLAVLCYLTMVLESSSFAKNRTIRIHSLNKALIELSIAIIITILCVAFMNMGIQYVSYFQMILILIPSFGIAKVLLELKKIPILKWGKEIGHIGVCLLLISILLTNLNNTVESICLERGVPYISEKYSLLLEQEIKKIPKYIGYQEAYSLLITRKPFRYYATPAQWIYQRDKGQIEMPIPSIQMLPDIDIEVILKQKGLKTLALNQETKLNDAIITLKELYTTSDLSGNKTEHVTINLQKLSPMPDQEDKLIQEDHVLSKKISQGGLPLEKAFFKSALYDEEIEWMKSYDTGIFIQSPRIMKSFEFEIRTKPFMLVLRLSYFLIIISLLWIMLYFLFESKLKKNLSKKKASSAVYRVHHTQKHHHH